jgi:glutathione S-transferase
MITLQSSYYIVKIFFMLISTPYILYSFRRCPYAMRARMALMLNKITVEIREIELKHKPISMLNHSPKGTVPVLIINSDIVVDESRDIMDFAIKQSHQPTFSPPCKQQLTLIEANDTTFKAHLDKYKYFDRFPQFSQQDYRQQGEEFLQKLEKRLVENQYLFDHKLSYADIAIFPFVRQFAHVDKLWFEQAHYPNIQRWLNDFLTSHTFITVMKKLPAWQDGAATTYFPPLIE